MMHYRKADIDGLVQALGKHWGGQARDWLLVVNPTRIDAPASVELHVEIALGSATQITTIPLGNMHRRDSRTFSVATAGPDAIPHSTQAQIRTGTLAAVRRASVQALCEQCPTDDIEPLLGYLRCCGVLVID